MNTEQFNTSVLTTNTIEQGTYYIKYWDYYLHDWVNNIAMIEYLKPKNITSDEYSYRNWWNFYNIRDIKKNIKITWSIKTTTREELLNELIKIRWQAQNQYLVIKENGKHYKLKWVFNFEPIENHYNITFIRYEFNFESYEYLQDYNTLTKYWTYTEPKFVFSNWWIKTSKFWIVILSNSLFIPTITVKINWYSLTINESFTAWDVLFIDWYTPTITKNWDLIDFTWEIPFLEPWYNEIEIIQNGYIDYLIYTNLSFN